MAYSSEAYDFSRFDNTVMDNTVPVREPKRQERKRSRVIELPQKELEKNRKVKKHPFRMMATTLCIGLAFSIVISVVYSQVRLTELTEEINIATQTLAQEESLEVQLTMQAAEKMNGSEVEEYAKNQLGMSKINEGQVHYVNVAQEDKGTVVNPQETFSLWESIVNTIGSWFQG